MLKLLAGLFGSISKALDIFRSSKDRAIGGELAEAKGTKDALKRSEKAKSVRRKPKTDRDLVAAKPKRRRTPKPK